MRLNIFCIHLLDFPGQNLQEGLLVGEHRESNDNNLNVCLNVFCTLPCLLSRNSPISRIFDFQALIDLSDLPIIIPVNPLTANDALPNYP